MFQCVIEVARREWGIHLAENPVRMVSRPSYNDERSRRLDPIEEEYTLNALELRERRTDGTYADASHNPWIRPIVQLAIETAMRRGEIFELRWKHVNLDRRTVHLPATKNGLPRTVPLSPKAIQLLNDLPRSLCGRVFSTTVDALKKAFVRGLASEAEIPGGLWGGADSASGRLSDQSTLSRSAARGYLSTRDEATRPNRACQCNGASRGEHAEALLQQSPQKSSRQSWLDQTYGYFSVVSWELTTDLAKRPRELSIGLRGTVAGSAIASCCGPFLQKTFHLLKSCPSD